MKRYYRIYFFLMTVVFFHSRCASKAGKTLSASWYEFTKAEILKQADLSPDSIISSYNEDRSFKKEHYFSGGHEYLIRGYDKGILCIETHFSKEGSFELRRELCDNGNLTFEGIAYKKHFYGLSTWRYCDGQLMQQGVRYDDKKVGVWKTFDQKGRQIEETDYRSIAQLDSMPTFTN